MNSRSLADEALALAGNVGMAPTLDAIEAAHHKLTVFARAEIATLARRLSPHLTPEIQP